MIPFLPAWNFVELVRWCLYILHLHVILYIHWCLYIFLSAFLVVGVQNCLIFAQFFPIHYLTMQMPPFALLPPFTLHSQHLPRCFKLIFQHSYPWFTLFQLLGPVMHSSETTGILVLILEVLSCNQTWITLKKFSWHLVWYINQIGWLFSPFILFKLFLSKLLSFCHNKSTCGLID